MSTPIWLTSDSFPPIDVDQRRIIQAFIENGNTLVEAPPGTGKTFLGICLALCATRLNWISKSTPALFLTFSRNARVQIELEMLKFRREGWITSEDVSSIKVANYHSFFMELLQKKAGLWGCSSEIKPAIVSEHRASILELLPKSLQENPKAIAQAALVFALQKFSVNQILAQTDELMLDQNVLQRIINYKRMSLKEGRPSYDDFAPLVLDLLETTPEMEEWLRIRYPLLILDEFQDTDVLQLEILKRINPRRLVALFDRFQMIYSWRGSRSERIQEVQELISQDSEPEQLNNVHRSDRKEFINFIKQLRLDDLIGEKISPGKDRTWLNLKYLCQPNSRPNAKITATLPAEALSLYYLRYKSVIDLKESTAIITRTNYFANYLYDNLRVVKGNGGFSCRWIGSEDSPEERIRNLLWKLRAVRSNEDLRSWVGSLMDEFLPDSIGVKFSDEFRATAKELFKKRRLDYFLRLKEILLPEWESISLENFQLLAKILNVYNKMVLLVLQDKALFDPDVFYYVRELVKFSNRYATKSTDKSWDGFCEYLESNHLSAIYKKMRFRPSGLYVLTAHQSKGREFDHVIIPWLSKNGEPGERFPIPYKFQELEDRKLLYVAITRAKSKVTIMVPPDNPSDFLTAWKLIPANAS